MKNKLRKALNTAEEIVIKTGIYMLLGVATGAGGMIGVYLAMKFII